MLNATRLQLMNHFAYLQQFMASPRTVGTLAPSSPWLCQAMLNQIEWTRALSIAELGAAAGGRICRRSLKKGVEGLKLVIVSLRWINEQCSL